MDPDPQESGILICKEHSNFVLEGISYKTGDPPRSFDIVSKTMPNDIHVLGVMSAWGSRASM
jgi:hypothetical protein